MNTTRNQHGIACPHCGEINKDAWPGLWILAEPGIATSERYCKNCGKFMRCTKETVVTYTAEAVETKPVELPPVMWEGNQAFVGKLRIAHINIIADDLVHLHLDMSSIVSAMAHPSVSKAHATVEAYRLNIVRLLNS